MSKAQTFGEFIMDRQADFPFVSGQLTRLLTDIGVAAKIVNQQVNRAGLTSILGASGNTNIQDEQQQKLDVFADDTFMRILSSGKSVCGIGSEEREDFVLCGENGEGRTGKYIVLIDPLDGSSNIDVNVSIGTIFSIVRRITPMGEPLGLVPAADVLIWLPVSVGGVGVRESVFALALEPWGILAPSAVAIGIVRWTGELARGAIGCMLMALGEGRAGLTFNADPKGEVRDE